MAEPTTVIGTVIHGTLRSEDLIPAFMTELNRIVEAKTFIICGLAQCDNRIYKEMYLIARRAEVDGYHESGAAGLDLDWLFCTLDAHAPRGCYFGSHEGDGSDFGFWEADT